MRRTALVSFFLCNANQRIVISLVIHRTMVCITSKFFQVPFSRYKLYLLNINFAWLWFVVVMYMLKGRLPCMGLISKLDSEELALKDCGKGLLMSICLTMVMVLFLQPVGILFFSTDFRFSIFYKKSSRVVEKVYQSGH